MIEIVITYDTDQGTYKIYEPTSETVLVSTSLTEGFLNLNEFLKTAGLIGQDQDILVAPEIMYHLDSFTLKSMIDSNVNLMKRLSAGPSEFKLSSSKFGQSSGAGIPGQPQGKRGTDFGGKQSNFGSSSFSSSKGFQKSGSKLGSNNKIK